MYCFFNIWIGSIALCFILFYFLYMIFTKLQKDKEKAIATLVIFDEKNSIAYSGDLVIENYPNLEKIVVKKNSLRNLSSLKICNNELLKTIDIEDGEMWKKDGAFQNVKNVIIESISIIVFDIFKSS